MGWPHEINYFFVSVLMELLLKKRWEMNNAINAVVQPKSPLGKAGFLRDGSCLPYRVLLGGLEPSLLAPEANALSTELQEREADFTINTGS